jgi:hypothetical protein
MIQPRVVPSMSVALTFACWVVTEQDRFSEHVPKRSVEL